MPSSLIQGLERVHVNSPKDFFIQRSLSHLIRLLVIQFFMQKRIESLIQKQDQEPKVVSKLFRNQSYVCLIAFLYFPEKENIVSKEMLMQTLQLLTPGISEVPNSFWRWLHPQYPYMCLHIEGYQLRGKDLSLQKIRSMKGAIDRRLMTHITQGSSRVFWPFNEEEAYKQLCILHREVHKIEDLPQVSIHLCQQTDYVLEFLINVARPWVETSIDQQADQLPPSAHFLLHFSKKSHAQFTKEICSFSLFLSANQFYEQHTINFLQARNRIVHFIQLILGPFRDYNGGLFEKQKRIFADLSQILSDKIPHFALFADKVFHALQPIEARMTLSQDEIETLLQTISVLINESQLKSYSSVDGTAFVYKTQQQSEIISFMRLAREKSLVYATFKHDFSKFFCLLDRTKSHLTHFQKKPCVIFSDHMTSTLQLCSKFFGYLTDKS